MIPVIENSAPQGTALTATVRPFADPRRLEVVVVIAWPPDPTSGGDLGIVPGGRDTLPAEPAEGEGADGDSGG